MKKILLLSLVLAVGFVSFGQKHMLKPGFRSEKAIIQDKVAIEPASPLKQLPVNPAPAPIKNNGDNPDIVNILTIGTSANGLGYGYGGGQKTMVWADDNLKALVNIHRMGPGSTPPSLSGYLAGDLGTNYGATIADWQQNRQIYAATLNNGGTYYLDAARYPQGGIYNPDGNTSLANAYITYFAPNLSPDPLITTWGGRSYGVDNCVNQADSTKHLYWYSPPPWTYIPDGFAISKLGVTLATDIDQEWAAATFVGYKDDIIVNRGVWNSTTHDFDYTMFTVPFPTTNSDRPSSDRVAFSPDGQTAWMVVLGNNFTNLDANTYPMVSKSTDAGLTWSAPINVVLDGTNGIPGITQHLLSDYRIAQIYTPPLPNRDEIAYNTGFDCRISVDKWGNPHIGVIVGLCGGAYSIITGPSPTYDSTWAAYDLYSVNSGTTWSGQLMGYPTTFRGNFVQSGSAITEDNRTCIASNMAGDKMFVTWNDTQVPGITTNDQCDIFARGFDLVENKITKNVTSAIGACVPDNVTFLSDIFQQATFQCTSYYVFSDYPSADKWTLPIVSQFLTVPGDLGQPVDFKYISDFSYSQSDFVCDVFSENSGFPTGINDGKKDVAINVTVFPNPFKGITTVSVTLPNSANITLDVTNIVGQKVMSFEKSNVTAGKQQFTIDGSKLNSGVYFCTVKVDGKSYTQKMIVQ
jgi:Secretion system C-terminal sorting domain